MKKKHDIQSKFDRLSTGYEQHYIQPVTILDYEQIRRKELLIESIKSLTINTILDAGCGPGIVTSKIFTLFPSNVIIGSDLSIHMLEKAKSKNPRQALLIQSDIIYPPFCDRIIDLVFALGVFDYIDDLEQLFAQVSRILKPHGLFIFTFPNSKSIFRSLRDSARLRIKGIKDSTASVPCDENMINHLAFIHGFAPIEITYITYGLGSITFPWSIPLSKTLEAYFSKHVIGRYFGWSCFCVTKKNLLNHNKYS